MRWLSLVIVGNTFIIFYTFKDRGKFERVGICQNIRLNLQNAGRALVQSLWCDGTISDKMISVFSEAFSFSLSLSNPRPPSL